MAIGGQSDRSYNHQLVINKLFDTDSIIFSDEDNQDAYSRQLEEEQNNQELIWKEAAASTKASLQFIYAMAQNLDIDDDLENYIKKVLSKLTNLLLKDLR